MKPLIWFDTDLGIDDAIALLWLLNNTSKIELGGISTVVGNFPIDIVTYNALAIAEYMNSNIPVYQGANVRLSNIPFIRNEELCLAAHGSDGLANTNLKHSNKIIAQDMPLNLANAILASNKEWILMPVGPLTNIAQFIIRYPNLKNRIKSIYMMGGGSTKIEFNILCDCEAANIVFNSGIPITMVPLDITTKIRVSHTELDEFSSSHQMIELAKSLLEFGTLPNSDCMHDPCTIIALLYPDLFQGRKVYVKAVVDGDKAGSLILQETPITQTSSEVLFLDSCDKKAVITHLLEGLIKK